MGSLDQFKGSFAKFTNVITKTSGDLLKSTKLSMGLAGEEEKLRSMYMEVGKKVYDIYAYGGSLGGLFDEQYLLMKKQEEKIKEVKSQLETIKGTKNCGNCGKVIEANAEFCPKCGAKTMGNEQGIVGQGQEKSEFTNVPLTSEQLEPTEPPTQQTEETSDVAVEHNVTLEDQSILFCPVCNHENEADAKFCLSCGRMLN